MAEQKLGDLTAEVLRAARLDRLAAAYSAATGKPCNCVKNKERLNRLHDDVKQRIIDASRSKKIK